MKKALAVIGMLFMAAVAHAATTADATQTQTTQSQATGSANASPNQQLIQNGVAQPDRIHETIANVQPGVLAAFSSSLNSFDCHYTKAGISGSIPGFGGAFQWNQNDTDYCVNGWVQAELNRQSTITADPEIKNKLQQASTNVKCSLNDLVYKAIIAAGLTCQIKPEGYEDLHSKDMIKTADGSTAEVRYVPVYNVAQIPKP